LNWIGFKIKPEILNKILVFKVVTSQKSTWNALIDNFQVVSGIWIAIGHFNLVEQEVAVLFASTLQ